MIMGMRRMKMDVSEEMGDAKGTASGKQPFSIDSDSELGKDQSENQMLGKSSRMGSKCSSCLERPGQQHVARWVLDGFWSLLITSDC